MQNVARDVTSLQSLDTQQKSAEAAWQSSRRAYELADSGFRGGITEYLEVLVAQKVMLEQQRDLALIRAQRVDSWILLMRDLGGGAEINAMPVDVKTGENDARRN